jgi:hypothetical protein
MKLSCLAPILGLPLCIAVPIHAQDTPVQQPAKLVCDENNGCTHQFIDGQKYKILTTDHVVLTVGFSANKKYARVSVRVANISNVQVDVIPEQFTLSETVPKERELAFVPYQKIVRSDASRAGWANAINAFGSGMATQQVTTQSTTNGTVSATSSNGTYANGSYSGSTTSTTSVPDYAAQARANENIRRRREAIAAESQELSQSSLKANSLLPGQAVSGIVYFDFDKKAENLILRLLIDHVTYEFPFRVIKQ